MQIQDQINSTCIAQLAREGFTAFFEYEEDGTPLIRVPELEESEYNLDRMAVFAFIHGKLQGQRGKGLRVKTPITGEHRDIYCYHPDIDAGKALEASDLVVWSALCGGVFDWTQLIDDSAGWGDGWDMPDCDELEQRSAFLSSLLDYEIIDLPAYAPLSLQELLEEALELKHQGAYWRGCTSTLPGERWYIALNEVDQLIILNRDTGWQLPLREDHIDAKGRLVVDGHVALTRATPW